MTFLPEIALPHGGQFLPLVEFQTRRAAQTWFQ
jgi:hypothetical protein